MGTTVWSYESVKGLFAVMHSGAEDPMAMLQNISEWEAAHASEVTMPSIAATLVFIWIAVDAVYLLRKKFKDSHDLPITRWL